MAVALHAAAAWVLGRTSQGVPAAVRSQTSHATTVSVRSVAAIERTAPRATVAVKADTPVPMAASAVQAVADAVLQPSHNLASLPDPAPVATPGVLGEHGADRYVPRAELTVAPVIDRSPVILYPADGPDTGLYVARLALYIDETGTVRHVEPEGPRLPDALAWAARQAFLAAMFSPGQIQGEVVKSLIRVEVMFESRDRGS